MNKQLKQLLIRIAELNSKDQQWLLNELTVEQKERLTKKQALSF